MKLSPLTLLILTTLAPLAASAASLPPGFDQIQTVVVIYGENRSFNNLYGLFPGANGIEQAKASGIVQRDRDGSVLKSLPPVWKEPKKKEKSACPADPSKEVAASVPTLPADTPAAHPPVHTPARAEADARYPLSSANAPFRHDAAPINMPLSEPTRDIIHRFYQNQMQINGGKNDMFVAWTDSGALTMSHYDGSQLPLWQLAKDYTLADNFFMAAFGGSYLNHMWLACACTPGNPAIPAKDRVKVDETGHIKFKAGSPASAMDGPAIYDDGNYTPDGYAVNTVQPAYQPSELPAPPGMDKAYSNPAGNPLPPQTLKTMGDALSEKQVSWVWYSGGFNAATNDCHEIYAGEHKFQAHHQPYNYFKRFAPGTADRAKHLKDESDMLDAIAKGGLPQVTFYKPSGTFNEHPGYANVMQGDMHIAGIVAKLQASPQWKNMAIIITYDENGGLWDHVAPPKGDRWGPGSRIPAMVISPFAKRGFVDHTVYDTTSILQFLTKRYGLDPLPGIRMQMGDLSNAFEFKK